MVGGAPLRALQQRFGRRGVSRAEADGKIRVQLAFDGGEILPVEMSAQAGKALAAGLAEELGTKPKR